MNRSWFLYFGRKLGMSKKEIMATRYGEMMEMISAEAISQGAKAKKKQKKMTQEEIFAME